MIRHLFQIFNNVLIYFLICIMIAMGPADGAFLLQKEKRTDGSAVLDVAGRDQQDQRFYLTKDKERLLIVLTIMLKDI